MTNLADGPLTGIKIVDLSTVIMGPYATQMLGDLGADVIKVEPPQGDSMRTYSPKRVSGMSGSFLNMNRNKRSLVLDLKRPSARSALSRLVATADVLIHNLRPAVIKRAGFDYDAVVKLNPDIIYCAAVGFGSDGPYAEKPAYDDMIQAASGMAAMFVPARGEPAYSPTAVCDKLAGQTICSALLAALIQRERGGGGQAIEVPMFESAIAYNLIEYFNAATFVPPLGPTGYERLQTPARRPYPTRDGYVCILPYSDKNWREFFAFVERDDLARDPRYATLAERSLVFTQLYEQVAIEAAKRTTAEWVEFCDRADIPCMPVISLDDIQQDPHVQAVEMFREMEHPFSGRYNVVRSPVKFAATPFRIRHHAPMLGQHSDEVLAEAGLTPGEIEDALGRVEAA